MTTIYKVHIYIAERNTPKLDPSYAPKPIPTGEISFMGHMWYNIQKNDDREECYGFAPANDPKTKYFISVPGAVFADDNDIYYKPSYKRTMIIEQDQYQKLKNKFIDNYYSLDNSCVDFVWIALKYAGFKWWKNKTLISPHGSLIVTQEKIVAKIDTYEGELVPSSNWADVKRIINPSELNKKLRQFAHLDIEYINPPPEEIINDFKLSAETEEYMAFIAHLPDGMPIYVLRQDRLSSRYKTHYRQKKNLKIVKPII